jgi:hypothetical protein
MTTTPMATTTPPGLDTLYRSVLVNFHLIAASFSTCLNIDGNVLAPGTAVTIYDCDNSGGQQFIAYDEGTIRPGADTTLCVSLPATNYEVDGAAVTLETCDGSDRQGWKIETDSTSISLASNANFCLDHHDDTLTNDGAVVLWTCNAATSTQRWLATSIVLHIRLHDDPTFCLNIPDGASAQNNGSPLNLWTCDDATNTGDTRFIIFTDYTVRPEADESLCVDLADSNSEWNLKTCDATAQSQKWTLEPVSATDDGVLGFVYNSYTDKCMSHTPYNPTNGGAIVPATCSGTDTINSSQRWELTTKTPIINPQTKGFDALQYSLSPEVEPSTRGGWFLILNPNGAASRYDLMCSCLCYVLTLLVVLVCT